MACGIMVDAALKAADMLEKEGISAAVIDCFTIKPLDEETVCGYAKKTGAVVTAENHNIFGGLGSSVALAISRNCPVPVENIAVMDVIGEDGEVPFLREKYHLMPEDVAAAAKKAISRK